jgi:glycosyltransferase involved in cell wall biosynthesis
MLSKPGEETVQGIPVKRFSYTFPWFSLSREEKEAMVRKGGSPLSFSLFWGLLFEKGVKLIHVHCLHRLGGIARTCAKLRHIPYVVSLHSGFFTLPEVEKENMKKYFASKWEWGKIFGALFGSRRVLDDAAAIICVGREEYEKCLQKYPGKHIYYLPNGVNVNQFYMEEHKREKIVLCVSRIDRQKNQLGLVRAFAKFCRNFDYRLTLCGPIAEIAYYDEIKRAIGDLGIEERVTIIPGLSHDAPKLRTLYASADFFVLPSIHEPFGIVILEAWAAKIPVIASGVGGMKDFCEDGKNALLFSGEEELLKKMEMLAGRPELKTRLTENGNKSVQAYSWRAITDKLITIYDSL